MPGKSSRVAAPRTSAAAAFSTSSLTSKPTKSSILKSAFAPTHLQLSLFASTIRSLESEQLRFHDTITGELRNSYSFPEAINCICWGQYRRNEGTPGKKKKRRLNDSQSLDTSSHAVVAVGTGDDKITLYSPLEGREVAILDKAHPKGTKDFVFGNSNEAWSLGVDGSLLRWDLINRQVNQSIPAPVESLERIALLPDALLLASQSTYLFDLESQGLQTIPCFDEPIHTLIPQPKSSKTKPLSFLAAAESKSTIGVYNIESLSIQGNLNAGNAVRKATVLSRGKSSVVVSVSDAGDVEVFNAPFDNWSVSEEDNLKTKRRKTVRRSTATIEVRREDKTSSLTSVLDACFDSDGNLILAVAEGSTNLGFERVSILNDEGDLVLTGIHTINRAKLPGMANEAMNGVKNLRHAHVNEAGVVIGSGVTEEDVVIEQDADDEDSDADSEEEPQTSTELVKVNGITEEDAEMGEAVEDQDEEAEEPTFGELVRARGIDTVDVSGAGQSLLPTATGTVSVLPSLTLATLLTQALNTNDQATLDTCLAQQEIIVIRATIERLDSGLALTLLHRLAERLHSRPGRAGSLLLWVQWTVVTHGGHLSSRPDVVKQLQSLHKVVQQRAQSLGPLTALKGKLDMLESQMALRKRMQENQMSAKDLSIKPQDAIYVAGMEEDSSSDEENAGLLEAGDDMDDEEDEDALIDDEVEEDEDDENSEEDINEEESDVSADEIDGEVNHDDVDSEDSDTSVGGLLSFGNRQVNGVKPH